MPLSRRGLFGVLAAAPAAAVGMVALPAKGETEIAELVIKVDTTEFDEAMRKMVRVEVQRDKTQHRGDWRAR